ncbi:outer membrane protein assembly factor BamB family protein, partial [Dyadobacter jejuensis]
MNTIIIFAAALFSCKNDFDLPLYPTYEWPKPLCDTTLKVVWQKIIAPDSIYGMAQFFAINGKNIYWVGSDHGNVESNTDAKLGYFEFDGKEIKESWTLYKDRSNDTKNLIFRNKRKFIVYEGKLIFTAWSDLFCFSENGELLWKNSNFAGENEHGSGGPFISGYGNKVYFPSDGNKITDESYLFEIDIETGKERLLFTEPMKDNLTSHLECPVIYTQNTDTIAAFQSRKWNIETQARRADMVAWNLSKNELLWRVDSLDRYAQSSSNPILFENNKLYYAGAFDIYCLDPFTGKLIWRQSFDD